LLPFINYLDEKTDGLATGPLFALCPAPNLRIFPYLRAYGESGFMRPVENAQFTTSKTGLVGQCSMLGDINVSNENVGIFVGSVDSASGISPGLIFLAQEGEQKKFIAAGELEDQKVTDRGRVYKWELFVSRQILVSRKLEMWVYDSVSNAFLKVNE
jgi:hypothetical protein